MLTLSAVMARLMSPSILVLAALGLLRAPALAQPAANDPRWQRHHDEPQRPPNDRGRQFDHEREWREHSREFRPPPPPPPPIYAVPGYPPPYPPPPNYGYAPVAPPPYYVQPPYYAPPLYAVPPPDDTDQ